MKKFIKQLLFVFLGICMSVIDSDAQSEQVSDLELWTGAKLNYEWSKNWSFDLENQVRLKSNISELDQNLTQLGVVRRLNKNFDLSASYRFVLNNDSTGDVQGIENIYRWNTDLEYKSDISRFSLSSRLRFQSKNEFGSQESNKNTLRLRAGVKYNIKKWKLDPQFSTEIFNVLSESQGFSKFRLTLGTSYKINKVGKISTFYRLEQGLFGGESMSIHIVGLRYQYTIKK